MYQAKKLKIDVAYVDRFLESRKISATDFSEMMGHSRSWWNAVKSRCDGALPENRAKLICTVLPGLDYEKLVIPEPAKLEEKADSGAIHELLTVLNRVERKLDFLINELG